ncbi:hypothetical protein CO178_00985 [candidate division WWE3 bacterium CG_4_9_14_3_um_filter_34_6]|uniref:Glycosyltransferase RgtA/B/C/D-like domain-containing protein n=1 Tax=candidate division WWE3 bacterium CG_4_9_14_3_um_filter_34_6 TaxID=1975079 RepID=A0A2M7X4G5_UNCKA|nr:MAG: hypothetical protein CO178_00985 [candidate division WWE3 bacterium CG_4_9_14_3_um_filter_34_6]
MEKNNETLNIFKYFLILIIIYSVFVRVQGLGYSNFQGDEVNPMTFVYGMDNRVISYLLDQKRAPAQYVINIINVSLFGYHGEAQIRFPFLIFGILAIYTFYLLAKKIFNKKTALLVSSLMAVNGLFIAFSRITQYQAFMYFLIPVGVLVFIKALEEKSTKYFIYSGLIMMVALLAHFDTASVMPFFIVGFIADYIRTTKLSFAKMKMQFVPYLKNTFVFFATFILPALIYYVPYFLNSAFGDGTSGYLEGRLLGGGLMPRTQITLKLLTMYIPKFHIYTLFILGSIGLLFKSIELEDFEFWKIKINKKYYQKIYMFLVALLVFASAFSFYPVKPRSATLLVLLSSIAISFILTFSRKVDWKFASLAVWFLGSYSFYFYIMKDPRTHVYVSMIPLFILASYGFVEIINSIKLKWVVALFTLIFSVSLLYVSGVNWVMFVDKSPEYPWWDKDFLGSPVYRIKRVRHEKIEGVFGFNNYRAWEQIADLYERGCLVGSYNSNEKDAITYFYLRQHQKQGGLWELQTTEVDNLVVVPGPHSWVYTGLNGIEDKSFVLLKKIYSKENPNDPISYIYGSIFKYLDGKLLCE